MSNSRLSPAQERELEDDWANDREAHALLDLINAEFQSNPLSTQFFDSRIVERVRWCVAAHNRPVSSRINSTTTIIPRSDPG
jgi:hypothetical protein